MEELLHLTGAVREADGAQALRDYTLEVFRGEIVYVQGAPGSGMRTLVSLLAGECALEAGALLLDGEPVREPGRLPFWRHGVYVITAERNLVEGMTVAENLEAVRYLPSCLRLYRHEESKERVGAFLRREGVDVPAGALVWSLSHSDRLRLSLLKARMHGARLIVLDATRDFYEGSEAQALCEMIRRENREGASFLILSECCCAFAAIATRIQLVDRGRDMKEWTRYTPRVEQVLRGSAPRRAETPQGIRPFLGVYDPVWDRRESFWAYLQTVRRENPGIWQSELRIDIPPEGESLRGTTVVIPEGSGEMLAKNLSVADNLILPCASRVAANRLALISRRVQRSVEARFCARFGVPAGLRRVGELSRVDRKLLSIYRFALLRPEAIVLESPYAGMMSDEMQRLRRYLRELADEGVRIICFSRSLEPFMADCGRIIVLGNGRNAKMSTK